MNLCTLSCDRRERKEQKEEVGGRKEGMRGRSRKKRRRNGERMPISEMTQVRKTEC